MATLLYVDQDASRERWLKVFLRAGIKVLAPAGEEQAILALGNEERIGVVLLDADSTGVVPSSFARIMEEEAAGPRPELHLFDTGYPPQDRARLFWAGVDGLIDREQDEEGVLAQLAAALTRAQRLHRLFTAYRSNAAAQVVDVETGLYNLRYLRLRTREEAERAVREHRPLSVIMVDLSTVREVSGEFGAAAGTELLKDLVGRAKNALRPYDIICRVGAERLAVLLTDMEPLVAYTLAKRMLEALRSRPLALRYPEITDPVYRDARLRMAVAGLRGEEPVANPGALLASLDRALAEARTGTEPVVVARGSG